MNKEVLQETFKAEIREVVDSIEKNLLLLEKTRDTELINTLFRALHTIKGTCNMFGFTKIAQLSHELESLFENIRQNKISVDKNIINITLSACDNIRELLQNNEETGINKSLINSINTINTSIQSDMNNKSNSKGIEADDENKAHAVFRIQIKPHKDFFLSGSVALSLLKQISSLGDHIIIPNSDNIPPLESLNPEEFYLEWTIIVSTTKDIQFIKDIFIFFEDKCDIKIDPLNYSFIEFNYKKLGEILLEKGDINKEKLEEILAEKKLFGQVAINKNIVSKGKIESALKEQEYVKDLSAKRHEQIQRSTIRVNYGKLDKLTNLISELVTLKAKYIQFSYTQTDSELSTLNEQLDYLMTELHEITMSIRMVPLADVFNSFNRMVRDISDKLGKKVELEIHGGETELDKNIIEELKDPLLHIIRNSIDHGIESPEIRKKLGKPETGKITLMAKHSGAYVYIQIRDDGSGLNKQKIKQKAINKGLLKENSDINDSTLYSFIFTPGFSTSSKTTDISGRGMGMDIVKKNIEKLKGFIEIKSEENKGSQFFFKIPLTLAIVDGLLVNVGNEVFVINLDLINECYDLSDKIQVNSNNTDFIKIRNKIIPFIRLNTLFNIQQITSSFEQLVIVKVGEDNLGLVVDRIIGRQQVVIKPIGNLFTAIEEISGTTLLGDGNIALILDVLKIHKRIKAKSNINTSISKTGSN